MLDRNKDRSSVKNSRRKKKKKKPKVYYENQFKKRNWTNSKQHE